jgi:actin related protein 2/3 complex subunit 2
VQEFVDARKQLRAAPSCMFGVEPPNELTQAHGEISENKRAGLGYLTVIVTKDHLIRDRLQTVVNMLTTLRTYLLYHIKCAKSYLHSRMRSKCAELLKVLNRAKVEEPAEDKKKK